MLIHALSLSGVHRVQRVPETESQGRVHTSTVTVAVLPEADEVDVEISTADLQIDTYRAGGAGGQHVNKTESAIRITHIPTGTVVECQDRAKPAQKQRLCYENLAFSHSRGRKSKACWMKLQEKESRKSVQGIEVSEFAHTTSLRVVLVTTELGLHYIELTLLWTVI